MSDRLCPEHVALRLAAGSRGGLFTLVSRQECPVCTPVPATPAPTSMATACAACGHPRCIHLSGGRCCTETRLGSGLSCMCEKFTAPTPQAEEGEAKPLDLDREMNAYFYAIPGEGERARAAIYAEFERLSTSLVALEEENDALTQRIGDVLEEMATTMSDNAGLVDENRRLRESVEFHRGQTLELARQFDAFRSAALPDNGHTEGPK